MSINRRTALKQFLWIAGGVVLIPSCMQKESSNTSIKLSNLSINGNDEQLLAELAETILPKTDTPGAKDLYLHQFIMKMVDDLHGKEDQEQFTKGLKAFDKWAQDKFNGSFASLTPQQKTELLQQIENKQGVPEEVASFYKTVKGLSIQGFLTSKYYLTNVQVYELVPGRFKGCVPVKGPDHKINVRPV